MTPPDPNWGLLEKRHIPPVRRGTSKRRARSHGMHMAAFWQMDQADREITYAISRAGRRAS